MIQDILMAFADHSLILSFESKDVVRETLPRDAEGRMNVVHDVTASMATIM